MVSLNRLRQMGDAIWSASFDLGEVSHQMPEASRTDTFQLCRVLRARCARARERNDQIEVASAASLRRSTRASIRRKFG
jgi:hypothetical protein